MKITELRIDNIIDAGNGTEAVVTGILSDGYIQTTHGSGHISEFKPVVLTEERLLKFGFEFWLDELGVKSYFKVYGIEYLCVATNGFWQIRSGLNAHNSAWRMGQNYPFVLYVHQLQNIYFALTGEELKPISRTTDQLLQAAVTPVIFTGEEARNILKNQQALINQHLQTEQKKNNKPKPMTAEKREIAPGQYEAAPDMVNHPPHYRKHPSGVECIQVTEHMNFNIGNAMKYLWRAGEKGNMIEDLKKARWYVDREVGRVAKSLGMLNEISIVEQNEALKDYISSLNNDNAWARDQNTMLHSELDSLRSANRHLMQDFRNIEKKLELANAEKMVHQLKAGNAEILSVDNARLARELAEANQKLSASVSAYKDLKKSYNKLKRKKGGNKS